MSKCCKQESRQSAITVQRIFSRSGKILEQSEVREEITLPNMESVPTATVSADRSVTRNLGHFNSLKLSCFCSVPCYLDPEEMENAMKYCVSFCESRIEKDCGEFYSYLCSKYPDIFKETPK